MSGSVTVPGAGGTTITIPTGSGDNTFVAQIIANSIILATTARGGAGVNYTTAISVGSGQWSLPGAPVGPGSDVAIIPSNASGDITIPSGYAYVIDESPNPLDMHGAGNVQIVSADTSGGSYTLSGQVSLAASGGNNTASIGGGSTTYNVAIGGTGTNSIKATGHGTVSGGTGTNTFIITDTASSGTLVTVERRRQRAGRRRPRVGDCLGQQCNAERRHRHRRVGAGRGRHDRRPGDRRHRHHRRIDRRLDCKGARRHRHVVGAG